jgi:hypothetical protein
VHSVLKGQYEEVLALNSILNRKLDESRRETNAYREQLRLHEKRATMTKDRDMDLLDQQLNQVSYRLKKWNRRLWEPLLLRLDRRPKSEMWEYTRGNENALTHCS